MDSQHPHQLPEEFLSIKHMVGFWPSGAPLVVMTAGKIRSNVWWGEYFVFVPPIAGCAGKAYSEFDAGVAGSGFPPEVEMVDADFLRIELKQKAIGCLSAHFSDIAVRKEDQDLAPKSFELEERSKVHIYYLIMNGAFLEDVRAIAQQTQHSVLRGYLSAITNAVTTKLSQSGPTPRLSGYA